MVKEKRKLKGEDYLNMSIQELIQHPDYSPHALRVIHMVCGMSSKELEELNINPSGRRK